MIANKSDYRQFKEITTNPGITSEYGRGKRKKYPVPRFNGCNLVLPILAIHGSYIHKT